MNRRFPDEFREGLDDDPAYDALWESLGAALPEAPTGRLRRRVRRLIWVERLRRLGSGLSLAGMVTAGVLGLVLGRLLFAPELAPAGPAPSADLRLETHLLSGATTAARLTAIVNLREANALPPAAAAGLARLVMTADGHAGVQVAALEALVAHAGQPGVEELIVELLARRPENPMVEARLKEITTNARNTGKGTRT